MFSWWVGYRCSHLRAVKLLKRFPIDVSASLRGGQSQGHSCYALRWDGCGSRTEPGLESWAADLARGAAEADSDLGYWAGDLGLGLGGTESWAAGLARWADSDLGYWAGDVAVGGTGVGSKRRRRCCTSAWFWVADLATASFRCSSSSTWSTRAVAEDPEPAHSTTNGDLWCVELAPAKSAKWAKWANSDTHWRWHRADRRDRRLWRLRWSTRYVDNRQGNPRNKLMVLCLEMPSMRSHGGDCSWHRWWTCDMGGAEGLVNPI